MTRLRFPKPEKRVREKKRPVRKTMPRRERKGSRAKLKRLADKLWSQIVRAAGKCRLAGNGKCGGALQAAHGFSRRYLATRHDLRNGWALCAGHHWRMTNDPLAWEDFLRDELGSLYEPLRAKALSGVRPDYELLVTKLAGGAQ